MKTFYVTDDQQQTIDDWDECKDKYHGAIGGHLSYKFIPTSIGTILRVDCDCCGKYIEFYDDMS
jgi:hypothetical protein